MWGDRYETASDDGCRKAERRQTLFGRLRGKSGKAAGDRLSEGVLHHKEAPALVNHLSGHINQYYCLSYVLLSSMATLLLVVRGELMPGTLVPLLYGLTVLVICYFYINWVDKQKLPNSIVKLKKPWRAIAFAAVWLLTIAIAAYVYPRITEYATVWNGYLAD